MSSSLIAHIFYAATGPIRDRLKQKNPIQDWDPERIVASQLVSTWGPPLNTYEKLISVCEERIAKAQEQLVKVRKGDRSSLYEVTRIGFKCVQVARGILVLSQPRNRKGLEAKGRTDGLGPSLRKSVWVIVIWRLTEY